MNNKCNCPNPPGGIVECGEGQMAICQIKNGKIIGRCVSPGFKRSPRAQLKWAISVLSKYSGLDYRYMDIDEQIELLKDGKIELDSFTGDSVQISFTLPKTLQKYLGISGESSDSIEGTI
ncbi:hypothetical protein [Ekhidna sp.]|uniref:hypothetical protein n=1 Tax=Ekhidna sp. TaxID=2608089 RepID=UPI003297AD49